MFNDVGWEIVCTHNVIPYGLVWKLSYVVWPTILAIISLDDYNKTTQSFVQISIE